MRRVYGALYFYKIKIHPILSPIAKLVGFASVGYASAAKGSISITYQCQSDQKAIGDASEDWLQEIKIEIYTKGILQYIQREHYKYFSRFCSKEH